MNNLGCQGDDGKHIQIAVSTPLVGKPCSKNASGSAPLNLTRILLPRAWIAAGAACARAARRATAVDAAKNFILNKLVV